MWFRNISLIFTVVTLIALLGTLVNMRYITMIKNKSDGDLVDMNVPVRPLQYYLLNNTQTVQPTCPHEYQFSQEMIKTYRQVSHKSLYNKSTATFADKVLILTPISNVGNNLANYFQLVCSLSYPHHLISLALGEDGSKDHSLQVAKSYAKRLENNFQRINVHHFEESLQEEPRNSRHDKEFQLARRKHMAKARNHLLNVGLRDEKWVLWVDADVKYVPEDLIQHLIATHADVTSASCMFQRKDGNFGIYDMNSWQETEESIEYLKSKGENFLMLEGYGKTKRRMLPMITGDGVVVNLDGVGGCALLINADCHRKGLIFPPFIFENHVETEGLAKMANKMGWSVKGLPYVYVFHS